ncbi:hypothetical protein LOAG_13868 [Loa loa]|uniref:Uncharacterized protein n=1 Tax=Loa loa TaxID=7209 RepID=A0A1S0TIT6_LOALO|nr:hypothetical protein LOAG_13868 [Loa loa]EFO14648.2 hypothetical protein LOAG_13868 [Loa loa]
MVPLAFCSRIGLKRKNIAIAYSDLSFEFWIPGKCMGRAFSEQIHSIWARVSKTPEERNRSIKNIERFFDVNEFIKRPNDLEF